MVIFHRFLYVYQRIFPSHQAATATFLSPLAHLRRQGVQLRASLVLFQVPSQHRALGDGRGAEPTLQEPGPRAAVEGGAGADGDGDGDVWWKRPKTWRN